MSRKKGWCHAIVGLLGALALAGWAAQAGLRWQHVHGASCGVMLAWLVMGMSWSRQGRISLIHAWPTLAACALVAGMRQAPQVQLATSLDWVGSPGVLACWGAAWVALGFGLHGLYRVWRANADSAAVPASTWTRVPGL